jgi:hypothetical protein
VDQAAADGESLYKTEKGILAKVLKMGHLAVDRLGLDRKVAQLVVLAY